MENELFKTGDAPIIEMVKRIYLEYFNDFLTLKRFGEYYGLTEEESDKLIAVCRQITQRRESQK